MIKNCIYASLIALGCFSFSYAEELLHEQAINYYNEGVKAQKAHNFLEADTAYQKVLLVDHYNPTWQKYILNNRGIILAKTGDLDRAEEAFNGALKLDENYMPAKINLGMIYEARRTRLESLEYWAKVFELDKLKPKDFVMEEGELKEKIKK